MASIVDDLYSLLGITKYQRDPVASTTIDSKQVERARADLGGNLAPLPQTKTRWYQKDLERAIWDADAGQLDAAALLWRSCKRDGVISGVLSTRTDGLVRLPKKFAGPQKEMLEARTGGKSLSLFDVMFPSAELAALAGDGIGLGVGVGVRNRMKYGGPRVFRRLDPQWLIYRWNEDRWYYNSVTGLLPVEPEDGTWVLHLPGGHVSPWHDGKWMSAGRAYIMKEHAIANDMNWQSKLANPARVAVAPQGASEAQKQSWFRSVMAWGVNTVFGMTPGYDVKLLESNGRGYESFEAAIARAEREAIISLTGQSVSTDGGSGFINSDMFKSIRTDLIKATADALAQTINVQGLRPWAREEGFEEADTVEWDVTPPKDYASAAAATTAIGSAIKVLTEALAPYDLQPDVALICQKYGVDVKPGAVNVAPAPGAQQSQASGKDSA